MREVRGKWTTLEKEVRGKGKSDGSQCRTLSRRTYWEGVASGDERSVPMNIGTTAVDRRNRTIYPIVWKK